jgi:hypothetical protein
MAPHRKEAFYGLSCELIYYVKRTRTVGGTRIVAEIDVIVFWHALTDAIKDGQSAKAGIEDANIA